MPRLMWAPPALLDIQRPNRSLALRDLDADQRAMKTIRLEVQVLGRPPGIGRPIEDLPAAFRDLIIDFINSGYMASHRLDPSAIVILAVFHQKEVGY